MRSSHAASASFAVALIAFAFAGAFDVSAAGAPARTGADSFGCAEQVFDPAGLASLGLVNTADAIATALGADLHVRIEGSLDGDIDGREQRLETQCEGWLGYDGLRAPNLLVVMVSPAEHQTSIYYGENFRTALLEVDQQIQQNVMNPRFKEGEIEQGLIDGLDAIETAVQGGDVTHLPGFGGVPAYSVPASPAYDYSSSSSSSSDGAPVVGIVALIALALLVGVGGWWAQKNGWTTTSSSSGFRGSGWGSTTRSFRSGHHSSSHHSSGSSSHHSGGGGSSSSW